GAGLCAVAADGHRAPGPDPVARLVVERPTARFDVATRLEARPGSRTNRVADDRQQCGDRVVDVALAADELHFVAAVEDGSDRGVRGLSIEPDQRVARERVPVMGESERTQRFAKFDQPDSLALADLCVSAQEAMRDEPAMGVARRLERIDLMLEVTRVQEVA